MMDMDVVVGGDGVSLDPDLLQLPELSPLSLKANSFLAEELFSLWLSLPDTNKLVKSLLVDAKSGTNLNVLGNSTSGSVSSSNSLPSMFPAGSTPPLSPRAPSGSPRLTKQKTGPSSLGSPLKVVSEPVREVIPQFYFKNGRPAPNDMRDRCLLEIDQHFNSHMDGLQVHEFKPVTREICKLPSFFSTALFRKIDTKETGIVTRDQFINYWIKGNMLTKDLATQIYLILKQSDCSYLTQDDFKPVLRELLASHPGLEFLQSTPEFQERYAETVIYRIFYYVNRSGTGRLTLRELKRGNLIAAMLHVDEEEDINKVLNLRGSNQFFPYFCQRTLSDMVTMLLPTGLLIEFFLRFLGNLLAKLRGRWVMKILFTLYCLKRINLLNLALNIGTFPSSFSLSEVKNKEETICN